MPVSWCCCVVSLAVPSVALKQVEVYLKDTYPVAYEFVVSVMKLTAEQRKKAEAGADTSRNDEL